MSIHYLIFSDLHLTDHFDLAKFQFLNELISSAEHVIINGDFWDSYFTSFEKFLNSPWQDLFPLLKAKQAIYLYGNHDRAVDSDERVNLFSSTQAIRHDLQLPNYKFRIEHGNKLRPAFSERYPWLRRNPWLLRFLVRGEDVFEWLMLNIFDNHSYTQSENKIIKQQLPAILGENEMLITGHTHCPEINLKEGYINTGEIKLGHASYISIDKVGNPELVFARYQL